MNHIEQNTCIRFEAANPYNLPQDYIEYNRGSGCWSSVGRVGGRQTISIGYGCDSVSKLIKLFYKTKINVTILFNMFFYFIVRNYCA